MRSASHTNQKGFLLRHQALEPSCYARTVVFQRGHLEEPKAGGPSGWQIFTHPIGKYRKTAQ